MDFFQGTPEFQFEFQPGEKAPGTVFRRALAHLVCIRGLICQFLRKNSAMEFDLF
jgi:hypothetical protein